MSFFAAVAFALSTLLLAGQAAPLTRIDRQRVQQMLKQVREDLEKHYYDPSFKGIDLQALFKSAQEAVDKAPTLNDAYAVLADTVLRLDDSHTVVLPPDRNASVDYGWRMAMVGDQAVIVSVEAGSDAASKGLAVGDVVTGLNRFKPERSSLWQMTVYYRVIRPQAIQHVAVRKPDGRQVTVDVASKVTPHRFIDLVALLNEFDRANRDAQHRLVTYSDDLLIWKMPSFGDPRPVDDAVRKARSSFKTLIVDLRGNGGGAVDTLNTMVSGFFDREVVVGVEKSRKKQETYRAKPKREPFLGKVIVLVDSESASAAEMFARIIQLEKRGVVIGDRTAGAVMTGRVFSHAMGVDEARVAFGAMITVGDVRMSDGTSLEKVGVKPDEVLLPTPSDLAAGRDPVLARAIALAGGNISAEAAGQLLK